MSTSNDRCDRLKQCAAVTVDTSHRPFSFLSQAAVQRCHQSKPSPCDAAMGSSKGKRRAMTETTTTAMPAQTSAPSLAAGIRLFKQAKIVMMVTSASATAAPTNARQPSVATASGVEIFFSRPSLVMSAAMMATKMKMIAAPRCALHPDAVMVCNRQMRHAMTATRCRPIAASMIAPWPAVAMESSRMASSSAMAPRIVQRDAS